MTMRKIALVLGIGALLAACGKDHAAHLTPGSRLIYHGGKFGVFTTCDRGNRVYYTETGLFQVLPGGCPDGQP